MARHIDFSKYPREVKIAAHTIGLDYKRPYQRHGRFFFRPYRNGFCAPVDSGFRNALDGMVSDGYMGVYQRGGMMYYHMTRAGVKWLGDLLGVTILMEDTRW